MRSLVLLTMALLPLLAAAYDRPYGNRQGSRSPVLARNGMVATSQPLATLAAVNVLQRGGNAVDAAVAAAAVLAVVEPMMTGAGGDVFALVWKNGEKKLYGLNASGFSPAEANLNYFTSKGLKTIPTKGIYGVTVPGAVDGWASLIEKHGTTKLADVLAPAIRYAEDGFAVSEIIAGQWERFYPQMDDAARQVYSIHENGALRPPRQGEVFRNLRLAASLRQIAEGGRDAYYKGEIGRQIVQTAQKLGWPMTMDDLAHQHSTWVEPIRTPYHGYEAVELPPNGQGLAALQMLNILENFDLKKMGHNSADYLHLLVEAKKLAFSDRDTYFADPAKIPVPVQELLSKERGKRQASRIDLKRAATEPVTALPLRERAGQGDTVYLTVVDRDRNAVSFINSIFHAFGSGVVAGDTGILLHNRGAFFSLNPRSPNRLEGRKRPLHTIIPGMLFQRGRPMLSFGVMGGNMQPQGHVQVLLNLIDFGMNVQEAGDAARFRHEPGELALESRISGPVRRDLAARGHKLQDAIDTFGGYQAIWIDWERGVLLGGSDPRKDGLALGW